MRITVLLFALMASTTVHADQTATSLLETQPISGSSFKDYRLKECSGIRGFGAMTYRTDGADELVLTDLCFDEASGTVVSAQSVEGLELVEKEDQDFALEVLDSGKGRYSRARISFTAESFFLNCGYPGTKSHWIEYGVPEEYITGRKTASSALFQGYSIGATSATPLHNKWKKEVRFDLRPLTQDGKSSSSYASLNAGAIGEFKFSGATASINLNKADTFVREPEGELSLQFMPDGEVSAIGNFKFKNRRLAGHHPKEWVTMEGKLDYMRGHLTGPNGDYLKGYGIASGIYVDASGETHTFTSIAMLNLCFYEDP